MKGSSSATEEERAQHGKSITALPHITWAKSRSQTPAQASGIIIPPHASVCLHFARSPSTSTVKVCNPELEKSPIGIMIYILDLVSH